MEKNGFVKIFFGVAAIDQVLYSNNFVALLGGERKGRIATDGPAASTPLILTTISF